MATIATTEIRRILAIAGSVPHWIGGKPSWGTAKSFADVFNPATGKSSAVFRWIRLQNWSRRSPRLLPRSRNGRACRRFAVRGYCFAFVICWRKTPTGWPL